MAWAVQKSDANIHFVEGEKYTTTTAGSGFGAFPTSVVNCVFDCLARQELPFGKMAVNGKDAPRRPLYANWSAGPIGPADVWCRMPRQEGDDVVVGGRATAESYSSTGSISDGSLFFTLPTRVLTGHMAMSSAG
jgi:hypothetical protein